MSDEAMAAVVWTDDAQPALPSPTQDVAVSRLRKTALQDTARSAHDSDTVAAEVPVALVFNGISHAVMMATPSDLEAFAIGFALSEGLMATRSECHDIEVASSERGIEVHLQVSARVAMQLSERRRTLAGRTGCGLCGIDSLAHLDLTPEAVIAPDWMQDLTAHTLLRAFEQLPMHQTINARTGACHAAAWSTPSGELVDVMEDVGRHNALDKLLGRRALAGQLARPGFVIMSSRASYELVRKCARLGVPALATISAPTSLAIDIARRANLRLYGFCRGDAVVRYDKTEAHDGTPESADFERRPS